MGAIASGPHVRQRDDGVSVAILLVRTLEREGMVGWDGRDGRDGRVGGMSDGSRGAARRRLKRRRTTDVFIIPTLNSRCPVIHYAYGVRMEPR